MRLKGLLLICFVVTNKSLNFLANMSPELERALRPLMDEVAKLLTGLTSEDLESIVELGKLRLLFKVEGIAFHFVCWLGNLRLKGSLFSLCAGLAI